MMSSPRILSCSNDTFKMYNSLCKSDDEKNEEIIGRDKIFLTRTPAIFLAAAIGTVNITEPDEIKNEKQLTRREYILGNPNYKIFETIIKSRHGLKTEHDIVLKIIEYAEYGIKELYEEFHKTGDIDFVRISQQAKAAA
jgi:hypothetical protein